MSRDVIERIRDRWQKLRLCRHRGTVLVDYRILRNVHLKSLKLVHHQGMCSSGLEIILIYYRRRGRTLRIGIMSARVMCVTRVIVSVRV